MLDKTCTRTAKTRAKPSLHRDSFLTYRDRFVAVLASGYAYSLNRRAVTVHARRANKKNQISILICSKSEISVSIRT